MLETTTGDAEWCTPLYFALQTGWSYELVRGSLTDRRMLGGKVIEGAHLDQEPGLLGARARWRIPVSEITRLKRRDVF